MNVAELLQKARARGVKIVTAESCTGGLVAAALTDVPGSSDVVERGFVTYSNEAKIELLDISPRTLEQHGAVSEEIAREMADGALKNSYAQLAVSITGIAGPGGTDHKPEGRVCFGLNMTGQPTRTETQEFGARGRAEVRALARDRALALLDSALS